MDLPGESEERFKARPHRGGIPARIARLIDEAGRAGANHRCCGPLTTQRDPEARDKEQAQFQQTLLDVADELKRRSLG